jgi:hypothetical protein
MAMNDRNAMVPMASPSRASRESLIEMLGFVDKIMSYARAVPVYKLGSIRAYHHFELGNPFMGCF